MRRTLFPPLLFLAFALVLVILLFLVESPVIRRDGQKGEPAAARIISTPAVEPPPSRKIEALKLPPAPPAKKAAVIMDDLGYSLDLLRSLALLKRPVTVSILPFAALSVESARLAREAGLEVMLHLPLQSLFEPPDKNPEGMISADMNREDIEKHVRSCLARVPWARGVNNHEGSKITEDAKVMSVILEVLKSEKLFFIDSRTTPGSVAVEVARRIGVPAASRQVFLDVDPREQSIKARLEELFRIAQKHGQAVGICHPKEETIRALQKYLRRADDFGVELVFASDVVR
jgi:polysaccharide deacetylase 2 family uncharacterized protein YibQ